MVAKTDLRTNDTKERILKEAERLYQAGGYSHMGLDQIAKSLNITRPALYHHFPGGKEELLVKMIEAFTCEKVAEWYAMIEEGQDSRSRFKFMLQSTIKQPLLDCKRMACTEVDQLDAQTRWVLHSSMERVHQVVQRVFEEGIKRGELRPVESNLAFFSFMSLCEQVGTIVVVREQFPDAFCGLDSTENLIDKTLDLWLYGLAKA